MTAQSQALRAYGQTTHTIRTPRHAEYDVFVRITRRLITAAGKRRRTGFPELAQAIAENRRLWAILAADVAGDGNALPAAVRAQIFYLAEFTQVHSRKVLTENAPVKPLIDINTAVMRGLRSGSDLQ